MENTNQQEISSQYQIGPLIGKGGFASIYAMRDTQTGVIWAVKEEPKDCPKPVLRFEFDVLSQIQISPYFPALGIFGETPTFSFFSMELLGPSIGVVRRFLKLNTFSFSTSLRTSYHILKGLEIMHNFGFVHRDLKPDNILIREGTDYPICIVDCGLTYRYINNNGKHNPERNQIGFRGTRKYAPINAHLLKDLSRRDDLISWFYITVELLIGTLPWENINNNSEVLEMKKSFDITSLKGLPIDLNPIYRYILSLKFDEKPKYSQIYTYLKRAIDSIGVNFNDPYEWEELILRMKSFVSSKFDSTLPSFNFQKMDYASPDFIDLSFTQKSIFSDVDHPRFSCVCKEKNDF